MGGNMAKRILIVDDEPDIIKILTYRLKAKGYETFSAATGQEGVDEAHKQKPDLILLDFRLPDMEGPEIAKQIRTEEALKDTPIILITASIDNIEEKTKECGAFDYISKPINPEILYQKIEKHIGL